MRYTPHALVVVATLIGGCDKILGYDDYTPGMAAGGSDSGGGAAGAASAGGSGGDAGAPVGGGGGAGGVAPTCTDGMLGQDETDVDCGGSCPPCDNGLDCQLASDCISGACAAQSCSTWARSFGSSSYQDLAFDAVFVQDELVVVGQFSGSYDFGGGSIAASGSWDGLFARLSRTNTHVWSRSLGADSIGVANSVVVDPLGALILGGSFSGTVNLGGGALVAPGGNLNGYVAKRAADGSAVWGQHFGGVGDDRVIAAAVDGNGDVFIAGHFKSATLDVLGDVYTNADANGATFDVFVAKLAGDDGGLVWSTAFPSAGNDQAQGLVVDAGGDVVVVGLFNTTIDFGGSPLSAQGQDGFAVKLDGDTGGHLWSRQYGGAGADRINGVAVDASDRVVVAGAFQGTVDFGGAQLAALGGGDAFVLRLTSAGGFDWIAQLGGSDGSDTVNGVAIGAGGGVVAVGSFGSSGITLGGAALTNTGMVNSLDVFAARLSAAGDVLTGIGFGSPQNDQGLGVGVQTTTGNVVITGVFSQAMLVGTQLLTDVGNGDGFVASIGPLSPPEVP